MSNERALHLFIADYGGCGDYVLAYDEADAIHLIGELTGEPPDSDDVSMWPDDKVFTLTEIDEPGHPQTSMLPAEWAATNGRGCFGGWA